MKEKFNNINKNLNKNINNENELIINIWKYLNKKINIIIKLF